MSHQLETIIGYKFKNPELLEIALTHTSYANESRTPVKHNERLEFLGDSVLQIVSADYLFHAYADRPEGDLTRIRASLVSESALFQFAQEIDLGEYLRLGRGEERCGGRTRPSVVSDAFEAVIAALYLDGGMEVARKFILPFITEGKHAEADYKTRLQEIVRTRCKSRIVYADSRNGFQISRKLHCVVTHPLHTKPQCLHTKQIIVCRLRRHTGSHVAEQSVSQFCSKGKFCKLFIVFHARIPLQTPFESSRIGDHTTDGTAVTIDVFGCGIDYDVCAKFERTNEKRGSYRIIDHERKIVPLCDPCKCRDVGHIQLWISNRLREDDSRLIRDL